MGAAAGQFVPEWGQGRAAQRGCRGKAVALARREGDVRREKESEGMGYAGVLAGDSAGVH